MENQVIPPRLEKAKLKTLARRFDIALIVLFGSRTRGDARDDSDLDVGVLFVRPPSPRQLDALETRLLDLFQDDLHLVALNFVNPELRAAVAREGRVVFKRREADWLRFITQNLHLLHQARRLREYDNDLIARFLEKQPNDQTLQRQRSATPRRQSHARTRAA